MRWIVFAVALGVGLVSVFFVGVSATRFVETRQQAAIAGALRQNYEAIDQLAKLVDDKQIAQPTGESAKIRTPLAGVFASHQFADISALLGGPASPPPEARATTEGSTDLASEAPPSGAIVGPAIPPPSVPTAGPRESGGPRAPGSGVACLSLQDVQTLLARNVQDALTAQPPPFDWRKDMTPLVQNALVPLIGAVASLLAAFAALRKAPESSASAQSRKPRDTRRDS